MAEFIYLILTGQAYSQGLAYSSHTRLQIGQVVKVPLRSKSEYGIVLSPLNADELDFELDKLREIESPTDLVLSTGVMEFMQTLAAQTFNLPSSIAAPLLANTEAVLKILSKNPKSKVVSENTLSSVNKSDVNKVWTEFNIFGDSNIYSRIMNLIRIILSENKQAEETKKILILYPESKYLSKVYSHINQNLQDLKQLKQLVFRGNLLKPDREAMTEFCEKNLAKNLNSNSKLEVSDNKKGPTKHLLLHSLRSGLFMPFDKIDYIILVDEANQNYIQEQNSLYFDSREAAYILAKAMSSKLYVIGNFPSARLWNYIKSEKESEKSEEDEEKTEKQASKESESEDNFNINFNITIHNHADFQDKDSLLSYKVEEYLRSLSSKHNRQ
jgi:primosomal protein N'